MKIVRYALVGGTAAVVDFVIFLVFAKLMGFNYLWVGAVGFVVATAVNYVLSIRHVFTAGVRFRREMEIALVFAVSLVGLGLNQLILYLGIGRLGMEMLLTKLLATGSVFLWNYGMRNHFVFRQPGGVSEPSPASTRRKES
jgi:putative flippase GtrA